jgi:uncharacterized paraquat-inducible protein A
VAAYPTQPGSHLPGALLTCSCCGERLVAGTDVCPRCNTDLNVGPRSRASTMSVVFGLVGVAALPLVCSIPAIVLAVQARREIRRKPWLHGREAAGWGLALGLTGCLIGVALIATSFAGVLLR